MADHVGLRVLQRQSSFEASVHDGCQLLWLFDYPEPSVFVQVLVLQGQRGVEELLEELITVLVYVMVCTLIVKFI